MALVCFLSGALKVLFFQKLHMSNLDIIETGVYEIPYSDHSHMDVTFLV